MTIDPKAVEAVANALWGKNKTAEAAIHAYHAYLERIGAKVLVPKDEGAQATDIWRGVQFVELPLGEQP